jgi:hypothetical protein
MNIDMSDNLVERWLRPHSCDFMLFDEKTKPHEVIERIYLNIAASLEVNWKKVYNALPNERLYIYYIVANILISQNLIKYTTFNEGEAYLMIDATIRKRVMSYNGSKITFE